jgi:hypothetical protein
MARVPVAPVLSLALSFGWGWYEWPDGSTQLSLVSASLNTYEKGKPPVLALVVQNSGPALEVVGFTGITMEDKLDTANQANHQEQLWIKFEDSNTHFSLPVKQLAFPKRAPTGVLVTDPRQNLTDTQLGGGVVYYMASLRWKTFWGKYEFEFCGYSGLRADLVANCEGHNGAFSR